MPFKDLLKRHKAEGQADVQQPNNPSTTQYGGYQGNAQAQQDDDLDAPEFTFMRTTTSTQEIITPPSFPGDRTSQNNPQGPEAGNLNKAAASPKRLSRFRRHSNADRDTGSALETSREEKRLSERLHFGHRSRSNSSTSVNLPADLPDVSTMSVGGEEENWEKRATMLARSNPNASSYQEGSIGGAGEKLSGGSAPLHRRTPSREDLQHGDDDIQEAIRLHESGDLAASTSMFGRLADPNGANNALSQVLYGLALRHGWGIEKDETRAVTYLSAAASNSASIEELALQAGMTKGGLAKGELTLAIFELANCFRNGWGVKKDAVAAKQYYETAANMGDTDAMNEVAWCYLEGFGCKKDKFRAAQYLRLAEEKGAKTVGNTWIWKDKYGGPKKN